MQMNELFLLSLSSASIGFLHTLLGPDHYIPLIMMAWAGKWSFAKLRGMVLLFGIGHVASTVLLVSLGITVFERFSRWSLIEISGEGVAAWLLIGVGVVYSLWGIRSARRPEASPDHDSKHNRHLFGDQKNGDRGKGTGGEQGPKLIPWIIITILILGPCEPMVPILIYAAAMSQTFGYALVVGVFALTTILTMLLIVEIGSKGLKLLPVRRLERFSHALAGAAITVSGLGIYFLQI